MARREYFYFPSDNNIANVDGRPAIEWLQLFTRWHSIIVSQQESGTTANRPTVKLWVGRRYFDTTLGYPVYIKQVDPSVIWVNGAGTAV